MDKPLLFVGLAAHTAKLLDYCLSIVREPIHYNGSRKGTGVVKKRLKKALWRLQNLLHLTVRDRMKTAFRDRSDEHLRIVAQKATVCFEIPRQIETALEELLEGAYPIDTDFHATLLMRLSPPTMKEMVTILQDDLDALDQCMDSALHNNESFIQRAIDHLRMDSESLGVNLDQVVTSMQNKKDTLVSTISDSINHDIPFARKAHIRQGLVDLYVETEEARMILEVLESLRFPEMAQHRGAIADAPKPTLESMLAPPTSSSSDTSFADWLAGGTGVYQVSAVPGRHKSALMKAIVLDSRTKAGLEKWEEVGGDHKLVMADYFVNESGTDLERSKAGLLRCIAFEVIRQVPEVLPAVLDLVWHADTVDEPWSLEELQAVVGEIGGLIHPSGGIKVAVFIDGLEKCPGDFGGSARVIDLLNDLSSLHNFKLCVSSLEL
jgi:hypothetical protein